MAAITVEGQEGETQQQHVEQLRQEFHEAEVEEAMGKVTTTMQPVQIKGKPCVGPTTSCEVEIEGTTVEALVDTDLPVTIASLDFLMETLGKWRLPNQTPQEWEKGVKA
jgi:hypothetical protein